jgi:hypothetical protein
MILFIGSAYVVLIGVLSLLKREELSTQFAIEAVAITFLFGGLTAYNILTIHPVLFLLIVYFVTSECPLLGSGTHICQTKAISTGEKSFNFCLAIMARSIHSMDSA